MLSASLDDNENEIGGQVKVRKALRGIYFNRSNRSYNTVME